MRDKLLKSWKRAGVATIACGIVSLAGCSSYRQTEVLADDQLPDSHNEELRAQLDQLGVDYDTEFVDQLTLPRVTAPIVTATSLQTTAPVGRNTHEQINPPRGANAQSNLGFFPTLSITATSQNNPGRVAGGDNQTDVSFILIPTLKYRGTIKNRHVYEISASSATESYDELSSLDSDNLQLSASIKLDLSDKVKTDIYGVRGESSDPRGTTSTRILDADAVNDEFVEQLLGARVTLGRRTNRLQLSAGVETTELDFTNNQQDQRDRQDDRVSAGVYLNLGPKSSVFLSGSKTNVDFEQPSSDIFDSTNTQISVGLGWEPNYTTSLLLQAGNLEKDFDDATFDDQDVTSYLGKISWLPTEFTSLNFYTSRAFEETTSRNSPVTVSDVFGVNLEHAFTDIFRGQVFINFIDDELIGLRQDETVDYGIGLFFNVNRTLSLGAGWSHIERESSDPSANFESDSYYITATLKPRVSKDFGEPEIQTSDSLRSSN